jgi:sugar diacid utilization regulator
MSATHGTPTGLDLDVLDTVADAIESGAGLFEVVRAASRALDANLALLDAGGTTLALTPPPGSADERALLGDGAGVTSVELRVADAVVGELRLRPRSEPGATVLKLVATLIATEVERVRGPERASEEATEAFVRAVLTRGGDRAALIARGKELAVEVEAGGSVVVARAHPRAPVEDGWRRRLLAVAESSARAVAPGAVAVLADRADASGVEAVVLLPGGDEALAERAGDGLLRGLQAGLTGFTFALGRSRVAGDPLDLPRAADEALLAANVAETSPDRPAALAFDETGAYRLLLSAMSEDPAELQRFYAETVEPLVAYDEQYETSQLVHTLETFLDADGNVAGTAQRLFTHRHTIRYRLERVRELSGLDVGSSDGREKLSLGLKAMRVLGIAAPSGPASEAGAGGGRVPRSAQTRDRSA